MLTERTNSVLFAHLKILHLEPYVTQTRVMFMSVPCLKVALVVAMRKLKTSFELSVCSVKVAVYL